MPGNYNMQLVGGISWSYGILSLRLIKVNLFTLVSEADAFEDLRNISTLRTVIAGFDLSSHQETQKPLQTSNRHYFFKNDPFLGPILGLTSELILHQKIRLLKFLILGSFMLQRPERPRLRTDLPRLSSIIISSKIIQFGSGRHFAHGLTFSISALKNGSPNFDILGLLQMLLKFWKFESSMLHRFPLIPLDLRSPSGLPKSCLLKLLCYINSKAVLERISTVSS